MPEENQQVATPWTDENPVHLETELIGVNYVCHASFHNCGVVAAGMTQAQAEFNAKQKLRDALQQAERLAMQERLAKYAGKYPDFIAELNERLLRNRHQ